MKILCMNLWIHLRHFPSLDLWKLNDYFVTETVFQMAMVM